VANVQVQKRTILVCALVAAISLAVVFVFVRGEHSESAASGTATAPPRASYGRAVSRSARIPAARIVRDARRHAPRAGEKYDPTASMIIPAEFRPCAECISIEPEATEVIEGAIPSHHIPDYMTFLNWFQEGTWRTAVPGFTRCRDELVARVGALEQDYSAMIALRVVGDGREARVVEVLAHPESWPAVFDDETRECFFKLFGGLRWPATQVVDMTFEWPLVFGKTTP
jgi:hypothetical protein